MPNSDSIVAHADVPQPTFVCSHTNPGRGAAWVHVAGELDMATTPQQVTRVAPIGRLERDPVERDDGRVLASQRCGLARLVLDDLVGEPGLAAEEVGHETELGLLADRGIADPLRLYDARVPLLRRGEVAEVRERLSRRRRTPRAPGMGIIVPSVDLCRRRPPSRVAPLQTTCGLRAAVA